MEKKGRVTGIGGIFFKSKNPQKITEWYAQNLGMVPNDYGSLFEFRTAEEQQKAYLQWSPMPQETHYYAPSQESFMINYRVQHIEALVEQLRAQGVTICNEIESYAYGKFVHILDPEGRKLELWEPVDSFFAESDEGKTR
jgi:predicted enzyme related to lactoylglutathione lyase